MSKRLKNLIVLHLIVLIFGYTGIWGKLISLDAVPLVWWRIAIALVSILLFTIFAKKLKALTIQSALRFIGVGFIIAAHWITFFWAIKVSNVSVALAVMASTAFFISGLDPLISKKKFVWYESILGIATIIGLSIIFSFETKFLLGICLALCSAFLAALFTVFNGLFVQKSDSYSITLWEMFGGLIFTSIYLFANGEFNPSFFYISTEDLKYLILLALLATTIGFIASVKVMEVLSPFTVALTVNLEPVYAIILAWIYFGEDEKMTWQFYLGTLIILSTIFINAYLKRNEKKKIDPEE
ncbi:MAG: DMT family transporter [Bacteroidota bacterium]